LTPAQRRTALIAWITVALAGAGLTWLGLVGFGLLLMQRAAGMERDWAIAGAVLFAGLAIGGGALWMIGRVRRQR